MDNQGVITSASKPGQAAGAVERAAQFIRDCVASGELAPGQRLVEPELAGRIGVSRATLREAYRALEAEGIVKTERYKGAAVRRLDSHEMHESIEIRELLGGLAARRAARRFARGPARAKLLQLMAGMEQALSEAAVQRYAQLNRQFHDLVMHAADSEQLRSLEHYLRPPAILRVLQDRFAQANGLALSMAEHRLIARALLDGDGERAEAAMRRHIRSTMRSMVELPKPGGRGGN